MKTSVELDPLDQMDLWTLKWPSPGIVQFDETLSGFGGAIQLNNVQHYIKGDAGYSVTSEVRHVEKVEAPLPVSEEKEKRQMEVSVQLQTAEKAEEKSEPIVRKKRDSALSPTPVAYSSKKPKRRRALF